jgi:hypothetical protein
MLLRHPADFLTAALPASTLIRFLFASTKLAVTFAAIIVLPFVGPHSLELLLSCMLCQGPVCVSQNEA